MKNPLPNQELTLLEIDLYNAKRRTQMAEREYHRTGNHRYKQDLDAQLKIKNNLEKRIARLTTAEAKRTALPALKRNKLHEEKARHYRATKRAANKTQQKYQQDPTRRNKQEAISAGAALRHARAEYLQSKNAQRSKPTTNAALSAALQASKEL